MSCNTKKTFHDLLSESDESGNPGSELSERESEGEGVPEEFLLEDKPKVMSALLSVKLSPKSERGGERVKASTSRVESPEPFCSCSSPEPVGTSEPDYQARERSPLRSDVVSPSPSYSSLSSPRSPVDREARGTRRVSGRGRRSSGSSRGAAFGTGRGGRRGRGSRTARGVEGESGWRRGERIVEVCVDDEDIPASLLEMIERAESARREVQMRESRRESRLNVREDSDDDDDDDDDDDENEFQDVRSFSEAQELFGGDRGAVEFAWSPMATFRGRAEEFQPENPGPTVNVSGPYEAFRVYWDDSILEHIVRETNRYAAELKTSSARFARDWYDTNVHEIMILFAFWMMLGVIQMPSIKSCFSSNHLLRTDVFRKLMTEARYWNLNRALHFVNNATRTADSSKLFPLGPVVDHLNATFKSAYVMEQKITIDEFLTLWKGDLSFRQSIRTKAAAIGIKTYELCESATGYLWSFEIYTGKDTSNAQSRMPKSTEIVVRLIRPLLNKGHQLYLDNWFNSPVLARFLKRNKTDCIGTLRINRKNVPALIQMVSLTEGTCVARHSGDVVVMAYQDKKPVYTISTCHGVDSVLVEARPGRPARYRPAVIADYYASVGGIDKKEKMLEPLTERKKIRKWYKKMFKRLLNATVFNSRILLDRSTQVSVTQQAFCLELVDEIIMHHLILVPHQRARLVISRHSALSADRLINVGIHFSARLPVDDTNRASLGRKYCVWCKIVEKRRRKTHNWCETCQVPLCYDVCFKRYHTE